MCKDLQTLTMRESKMVPEKQNFDGWCGFMADTQKELVLEHLQTWWRPPPMSQQENSHPKDKKQQMLFHKPLHLKLKWWKAQERRSLCLTPNRMFCFTCKLFSNVGNFLPSQDYSVWRPLNKRLKFNEASLIHQQV